MVGGLQGHSQRHAWSKTNTEEAREKRSLTVRETVRRSRERKDITTMIGGIMWRWLVWRNTMGRARF